MKLLYNSKSIKINQINLIYSKEYKNITSISDTLSKSIMNNFLSKDNTIINSDLIDLRIIYSSIDFRKEIKMGSEGYLYRDLLEYILINFNKEILIENINSIKNVIQEWILERKIENIKIETKTEDFDKVLKIFFDLILEDKKINNETLRFFYTKYIINSFISRDSFLRFLIIEDIERFELGQILEIIKDCKEKNIILFLIFNSNKYLRDIFEGNLLYFDNGNLNSWVISEEFIIKFITSEKWAKNENIDKAIFSHDLLEIMNKHDFEIERERISKKISDFLLNVIDENINEEIYSNEIREIIKLVK